MLRWLFRKQIGRDTALAPQFAKFSPQEMMYLNGSAISAAGVFLKEPDDSPIDFAAYVHAAMLLSVGAVANKIEMYSAGARVRKELLQLANRARREG